MLLRLLLSLSLAFGAGAAVAGPVDDARLAYIAGNYSVALQVLIPAAEAGDPNAQNIVGAAYEDGNIYSTAH